MPDGLSMTPMQQAVVALQAQRARIEELENAARAPIAVVGMACRYPAGGVTPAALWEAVAGGRDGSREVPADRWDIDRLYDPEPGRPGKMYVRKGCFIDGVDQFEPLFFRISPREAVAIDPQQRLLLEVTWEALEDAGMPPPTLVGSPTGVFVGISTNDYSALLSRTAHGSGTNATAGAGNAASVASGRLSYTFGFTGPCLAVDTACSSSLVATHLAVQALRNNECGMAVVAGVNLMLTPDITVNFCQGRMLAPDGHCKTFDAAADGYARGEGCGVLLLKRLCDAVADGDRVLAVVRGSALNQDGRSAGLTAPNGLAQEAVIRKALANAGLQPADVDYIEAHGTGTALGDPIEMHALKAVFAGRGRPLYVGSVKTNIGHAEAAAGVAGLTKAILMLRHQALPPNLHFSRLNPHIELSGADIRVPTELVPQHLATVGVSSFGFSGTNAHIVLQAAPPGAATASVGSVAPRLLISARTPDALRALVGRYREHLATASDSFADICHTAAVGRARFPWWVCVADPADLANAQPSNAKPPELPPTAGRRVALPLVAFQRERFWIDAPAETLSVSTDEESHGQSLPAGVNPLLGSEIELLLSDERRWESVIDVARPQLAFLSQHCINGVATMPAAGFAVMALAAHPDLAIADLEILAPMPLEQPRRVQLISTGGGFRIVSVRGGRLPSDPILHVTGRVVSASAAGSVPPSPAGATLDARAIYAAMTARGVSHGPSFQLLDAVYRVEGAAWAALTDVPGPSFGALHPALLDAAFQLVAAALGDGDDAILIPAGIARLTLHRPVPARGLVAHATAARDAHGVRAEVSVSGANGIVLEVRGLQFRRMAADGAFYRLDRDHCPLIRGLAPPAFFPAPDALAAALARDSQFLARSAGLAAYARAASDLDRAASGYATQALERLGFTFAAGGEFTFGALAESLGVAQRHHRLLRRLMAMLGEDGVLVANGRRLRVTGEPRGDDPVAITETLIQQAPHLAGEIRVLQRCGAALADVLTDRVDPLSLLFPAEGDGARAFYESSPYACAVNDLLTAAARNLAATLPRGRVMRVLEVGAGTGGATGAVLRALPRHARHYVFTDLSAGFLAAAAEKFAGEGIETRRLDIERSPLDQEFSAGGFDVVLAANVLHATRDLRDSLGHIATLLAPGGVLLLVESTQARRWVDIVFGLTEGWWRFTDTALRPDHPLLDLARWRALLAECGFEPADADSSEVIVAAKRREAAAPVSSPTSQRLSRTEVVVIPPAAADEAAQVALLSSLVASVRAALARPPAGGLVFVADESLGHAGVAGFVRTLSVETPALRPRLLIAPPSPEALADELEAADGEPDVARSEVAWPEVAWDADGRRLVPRLSPAGSTAGAALAGTWLITGGGGGVGRTLAAWLAGHGAASIVLLSRAPAPPLPDVSVPVHVEQGDAADAALLARLLARYQVDGVVHAAGLLADAPVEAQTEADIRAVIHPKIGGALALDAATRAHPVRHFVLCGSVAGVLGAARQANHAYCSAFLIGLAERRRADGLPALTLDWGVWSGVGSAAARGFDTRAEQLGLGAIAPAQGAALFGQSLGATQAHLLVLPTVDWRRFTAHFEHGPPGLFRRLIVPATVAARTPQPAMGLAPDGARDQAQDLARRLAAIVCDCLGISGDVDFETPLHDLGLDSLVAVEIRNRAEKQLGLQLSVRDLIEGASLRTLLAARDVVADAPRAARRQVTPDLANRFEPFPLTDMQQAYWFGQRNDIALGSVSCYLYTEFDTTTLDLARAEAVWNVLIRRHDMLRAVIRADGRQQIRADVPHYAFKTLDLRGQPAETELDRLRRSLPQRVTPAEAWPLFDIRVTLTDGFARLHMGFDLIALDAASIHALRREWGQLYDDPAATLPPIGLSFRDVVLEQIAWRDAEPWRRSEAYWQARIPTLPGGPDLPLAAEASRPGRQRFRRRRVVLDAVAAAVLRGQAQAHGLTLPALLAAAYADTLAAFSGTARFCITVTSFNRPDVHPDIGALLGDFTSTILLEVDARGRDFAERAAALARQLAADLEHAEVSGIHVLREAARQGAWVTSIPVVFTSALGFRRLDARTDVASDATGWDRLGTTVYNVSSTPQVLIDHQISEEDGQLFCNWDVAEGMFPAGMIDAMVARYEALLSALATDAGWRHGATLPGAPPRPPFVAGPAPDLLQAAFERRARENPSRIAVIAADRDLDYGTLDTAATCLAASLRARMPNTRDRLVAVSLVKGWRQVVAVLAVLKAGAAYLPVDPALPPQRRRRLIERAEALVLDDPAEIDAALAAPPAPPCRTDDDASCDPSRLAYVIYTSGSTGEPKGVMIEHRAAVTTVAEINRRWRVGPDDRVLALSSLSFDLSVFDIFGPLSAGGAVVIPPPESSRDPSHWADLLIRHRVTLWNSVPALMAMQTEYGLPQGHALRLVLMSGDWIPLALAATLLRLAPQTDLVALGGATEAAIWSNAHPIAALDPDWPSIPYGAPLAGQMLRVVSERGEDCPQWVAGEIQIAGSGLARGYLNDPRQTAERFVIDPATGERWYRTGDLGRLRPFRQADGSMATEIEFLGRQDSQVKVQGHRIELGEIEAALATHPAVAAAVATATGVPGAATGRDRALHAFVVWAGGTASGWDRLLTVTRDAAVRHARSVTREDFEVCAATFTEQAAAAAAAAMRALTGSYSLPDVDEMIERHGVAPRYRSWLARMLPEVARVGMAAEPFSSRLLEGADQLGFGPAALDFLDQVIASLPDILTERTHSGAIYLSRETPDVYATLFAPLNATLGAALQTLAVERPVSLLEVGGGLGTTLAAVEGLLPTDRLTYRFTDISPHLLRAAAARFPGRPWLSFAAFDIDAATPPDGVAYDVILASSALHVARDVGQALRRLRACLASGGTLILLEQTRFFPWFDLSMGLQSGFDDRTDTALRPLHPLLSRTGWLRQLEQAGFAAAEVIAVPGSLEDLLGFDVILATPAPDTRNADAALVERLRAHLRALLPDYMLPTTITAIERVPLSANGKVDRRALVPSAPAPAPTPAIDAAADRLTREVAAVVAEVMQVDRLDPDRSLFELGATSLTLVTLQRVFGERLGRQVPLQRIFERPTIRDFATEMGNRAVTSPLIHFGATAGDTDDRPRLIMMPGVLSLPFYLRELAEAAAGDLDIISVQLPGLAPGETPLDTVEDQAEYVIDRMRKAGVQPPYLIGGHSFGGLVAIEAARRLRHAGEAVPLLLLGDTVRTYSDFTAFQADDLAYRAMARALYALYGRLTQVPFEALDGLSSEEKFNRTARRMQQEGLFGALELPLDRMVALFKANFRAIGRYRPDSIPGDLALIRTEGGMPREFLDFESGEALRDPGLGWTGLVQGAIDVRVMPGDHLGMLDPGGLPVMADLLAELTSAALARHLRDTWGVRADPVASPAVLRREIARRRHASL